MSKHLPVISGFVAILVSMLVPPCLSLEIKKDKLWTDCPDLTQFFADMSSENRKWPELYEYFQKFNKNRIGCDDGVYAEGYDDYVVHRLAKHWDQTNELIGLMNSDPQFGMFIMRHIGPTADSDELRLLVSNARNSCPQGQERFCSEAISKAEDAIDLIEKNLHHNQGMQRTPAGAGAR